MFWLILELITALSYLFKFNYFEKRKMIFINDLYVKLLTQKFTYEQLIKKVSFYQSFQLIQDNNNMQLFQMY